MQNGNGKTDAEQDVNGKEDSVPMLTELSGLDDTSSDNGDSTEDDLSGLPVDRGWAWVVLIGAVWEVIIYGGLMKCYGVFFVQFQKRFGSSASETTLIQTLFNVFFSISGIFVMTVGMKHMTARTSIWIGGIMTSMAYAVSAFAWRIEIRPGLIGRELKVSQVSQWLLSTHCTQHTIITPNSKGLIEIPIFFLGAVAGVAASMIFLPVVSSVSIYFNEYRAMANSINMAGASLGALVFGPLYSTLFDYYGFTGTMLISSGLLLNILVTGCVLRSPESFTKRVVNSNLKTGMATTQSSKHEEIRRKFEQELQVMNKDKPHNGTHLSGSGSILHKTTAMTSEHRSSRANVNRTNVHKGGVPLLLRTISGPSGGHVPKDTNHLSRHHIHEVKGNRIRSFSECNHPASEFPALNKLNKTNLSLYSNIDSLAGSLVSLGTRYTQVTHASREVHNKELDQPTGGGCSSGFKTNVVDFLRTIFDPSVLRDPVFIHFIIMSFVSFAPSVIAPVYFVPFSNDIGISSDNINILLVLIGCIDLISRITVGIIADRKWLRPTTLVAIAFIILGVVHNLIRFIHTFPAMVAFVIIESSLTGVYIALFAVILVENLGIEKFKSALGFTSMSHGMTGAAFFPITGALRDATGAFHWTYSLLSVLVLLGAVLALTLPITHRRCHKSNGPTQEKIVE